MRLQPVLISIALAIAHVVQPAAAAPKVHTAQECKNLAEMGLLARALHLEGIGTEQSLKIFSHIYEGFKPANKHHHSTIELAKLVIAVAQRHKAPAPRDLARIQKLDAELFHDGLLMVCLMNKGDLDNILGTST